MAGSWILLLVEFMGLSEYNTVVGVGFLDKIIGVMGTSSHLRVSSFCGINGNI